MEAEIQAGDAGLEAGVSPRDARECPSVAAILVASMEPATQLGGHGIHPAHPEVGETALFRFRDLCRVLIGHEGWCLWCPTPGGNSSLGWNNCGDHALPIADLADQGVEVFLLQSGHVALWLPPVDGRSSLLACLVLFHRRPRLGGRPLYAADP